VNAGGVAPAGTFTTHSIGNFDVNVVRLGLNYKSLSKVIGRIEKRYPWEGRRRFPVQPLSGDSLRGRRADTMTVAAKVAEIVHWPDAIFIDGGGPGGVVVDRLRQLRHSVFEVQFGGKADHSHIGQDGAIVYANKRAEMWVQCGRGSPVGRMIVNCWLT
jgi:hypothetical protein